MELKLELLRRIAPNDRWAAVVLGLYTRLSPNKTTLSIMKTSDGLWRVSDGEGTIHVFTPYRALNYSRGICWRTENLATFYGYNEFYTLNSEDTVIDIGANIGEFSMFCLDHGCNVHAFEPDGNVFHVLQRNIAPHPRASNIYCRPIAIADTTGQRSFWLSSLDADSTLITPEDTKHYTQTSMPAIRLDDYVTQHGIQNISLLKCDAEGAEPEVIMGCEGALPIIRTIAIDCSPERNGKWTNTEVASFLTARGFAILTDPLTRPRGMLIARNLKLT